MSVVSAQNPALTRLYELLDLSMISNLTAMDIIHATLDSYEVSATTKVQLDTIDQIRTHISAQKIAIARSKIITVPDGYPSVSLSSMDAIFDTVHTL